MRYITIDSNVRKGIYRGYSPKLWINTAIRSCIKQSGLQAIPFNELKRMVNLELGFYDIATPTDTLFEKLIQEEYEIKTINQNKIVYDF